MTFLYWALGVFGAAVVAAGAVLAGAYASPYAGAALALAAVGAAALAMAARQTRVDRSTVLRRHCQECGASIAEGAGFCPRCHSVRIQEAAPSADAALRGSSAGRAMPVSAYSPDGSGTIGWVDAAPPGFMGEGATSAKALRRWGALFLGAAALLCAAGVYPAR